VYSSLFAIGEMIFGASIKAALFVAVALGAGIVLSKRLD
jgi:hypothetical protein